MSECAAQRALRMIGVFLDEPEALGDVPSLLAAIQRQVEAGCGGGDPAARNPADFVVYDLTVDTAAATVSLGLETLSARLLKALQHRLRRRKVPADAGRLVQSLRETSLELDQELGRMVLSASAANDDPAREVERLALAIAEGAILIALSAWAKAARASELPSASREE